MTEIYIESRNEDGERLVHRFASRESLLKDLNSEIGRASCRERVSA